MKRREVLERIVAAVRAAAEEAGGAAPRVVTTPYTLSLWQPTASLEGLDVAPPVPATLLSPAAVALGAAVCEPDRWTLVVEGEGAALRHLQTLVQVAQAAPVRLRHVVLDDGIRDPWNGKGAEGDDGGVAVEEFAWAAGYAHADRVDEPTELIGALDAFVGAEGPAMLVVGIEAESPCPERWQDLVAAWTRRDETG